MIHGRSAMFEGFTETGLKLALRCFLPNLENRGVTIHGLHTAIDRKFRAAGIDGAYGDLRVRLARDHSASQPPAGRTLFTPRNESGKRKTEADRQGAA